MNMKENDEKILLGKKPMEQGYVYAPYIIKHEVSIMYSSQFDFDERLKKLCEKLYKKNE